MNITTYWTDYPIVELGDESGKTAPIRECKILAYDQDKYCQIEVNGIMKEIKRGYIYNAPGRCQEVSAVSHAEASKYPVQFLEC